MATIGPVTLTITPAPNTNLFGINVNYRISGSNHDVSFEMSYREVCQLIGDDTPGDGTDDPLHTLRDATITFSGTSVNFDRGFHLTLPANVLDEDRGTFLPQADEIRALVTLTPILQASRESNQVTINASVVSPG